MKKKTIFIILILVTAVVCIAISWLQCLFGCRGGDPIDSLPSYYRATSDHPIVFDKNEYILQPNRTMRTAISIYNSDYDSDFIKPQMKECVDNNGVKFLPEESINLISVEQEIPHDEEGGYSVILRTQPFSQNCPGSIVSEKLFCAGKYVCTVFALPKEEQLKSDANEIKIVIYVRNYFN